MLPLDFGEQPPGLRITATAQLASELKPSKRFPYCKAASSERELFPL